jgi:hypothetical protein
MTVHVPVLAAEIMQASGTRGCLPKQWEWLGG